MNSSAMVLRNDVCSVVIIMFSWFGCKARHKRRNVSFKKYVDFVLYEQESNGMPSRVSSYYCPYTVFQKLPFSKFHFSEAPSGEYDRPSFCISSLKKCCINFENHFTNKIFMLEKGSF